MTHAVQNGKCKIVTPVQSNKDSIQYSLNSRDLFLNLRRLVKMTKPLRFENKSLRLKYKCLICIWIIFWAILDLFIHPKYLFQNKSFSQTYYFKSEKSFVILTSLLGLKINPGNLESSNTYVKGSQVGAFCPYVKVYCFLELNLRYLKTWNCFQLEWKNYLSL